ncbi:DUF2252 family protein [Pseudoalteromonas xiamenensis]
MERSTWLKARLQFVDGKAPDQSIAKHLKMATSPFYFFRGSASVFYADIHSNHLSLPNELLSIPLTTIMGDCHVSNFGFISEEGAHGETLIFAPNDFDDACIGHAAWDLLRYLVSLPLAQQEGVRLKQEFINDQSPDREKESCKSISGSGSNACIHSILHGILSIIISRPYNKPVGSAGV